MSRAMENTERNKFERAWQDVFAQAEQTPSQEVWMGVERNLAIAEGGQMKRQVVFYQRVAAAAVLMALALGAITTYYVYTTDRETSLAQSPIENSTSRISEAQRATENKNSGNTTAERQDTHTPDADRSVLTVMEEEDTQEKQDTKTRHANMLAIANPQHELLTNQIRNVDFVGLDDIYVGVPAEVKGKPRAVVIVRKLPALPATMMAETKQKNKSDEQLWATLGAAAGNYTPQVSGGYAMNQASSGGLSTGNQGSSNSSSKGNAYSVGFNVGTRLSDRWVVQGGLAYMNQAINYTSNLAAVSSNNQFRALVADYALSSSGNSVTLTNPYELSSSNEYVSIPVQAGYLVLNRKAGIQINSGLATDIFLRNTLTDKSGQLDTYSESAGENSPYRTFSWSALVGTELSYRMGNHYRMALVPGLRYSLSPVVKSDATSNPLIWDLGFRFRYIFK